jgi:hypothetical protein
VSAIVALVVATILVADVRGIGKLSRRQTSAVARHSPYSSVCAPEIRRADDHGAWPGCAQG